jgi:hypothetical protein
MGQILKGSIDLNKIEKSKIVTLDKTGQPFKNGAKYLSVTIFINDEADQYQNNASMLMDTTLAEREAGVKPTYIGNFKFQAKQGQPAQRQEPNTGYTAAPDATSFLNDAEPLPF